MRRCLFIFVLLSLPHFESSVTKGATSRSIEVSADPRVELFSILFRLAGHREYNDPKVPAYAAAVDRYFKRFRGHAAVEMARRLRTQRGIYINWKTMIDESLVRACVVLYLDRHQGPVVAEERIQYEVGRRFLWTRKLCELLRDFEPDRDTYTNFESFMPRVVDFFEQWAE